MSTNVGSIDLELLLNSNKYNKQLKNITNISKSTSDLVSNSLSKIGKVAVAAFSAKKIFDFGKECINLGSDLAEVQNVVDVSFATMSDSVNKFAENAIEQFGLGQTVTKKYMGTFGAMSKSFGFAENEAFEMSKTLTGLAGDVASFYNLSSDEAYTKIKSVFTGETETLKDLGVVMTQTALDQYALANGFGKTTSKMSEQEKVALRYKFVTEQLNVASGDFVRTQDSWANQTRVLTLRFNEFKVTIGQGLINIFTPVIKVINGLLAKLQVLADAFKAFTEMIFGNAGGDNNSSSVQDLTTDAQKASDAVSGIGASAKKSAKDLKSLASFDTAQVLSNNSDNNSSGTGSVSSGLSNATLVDNSILNQANSQMDSLLDKSSKLIDIFKEGFNTGNINFDGILDHLLNIKNAIIDIWTDKDVIYSAQQWVDTCLYSLGQMTGAVARVGTNIAEFFVGSIDIYLEQYADRVKAYICNMFDISSEDMSLIGKLGQVLGAVSDIFKGDQAKQVGANIVAMFANPFMSITEICFKFAKDIKAILFQPIVDNANKLKETFSNLLTPIQTITGTLAEAFTYVGDKWNEVYDQHISPLMESIKVGLSDTFGKFLDVYNTYVVPFLQNIANNFNNLWNSHLKPFMDNVTGLIGSIIDAIKTLWEKWLKPFVDWIVQNIIPVLVPIFESIWNTISNIFGAIVDTIGGIIQTLKGLIDFIVGIFTGDWNKAWNGIKSIFTGIWEAVTGFFEITWSTIKGIVETYINIVKAQISAVLSAIKLCWENTWDDISRFLISSWNAIKTTISNMKMWIVNAFQVVYNQITSMFANIGTFFSNVWDNIKNTFSRLGTSIGDAISNAVKSGINGVISLIERTINKAINLINNAIGVINLIPGVNVGKIRKLNLPRLAEGGYFKANQPTLAIVGDNKTQSEIVSPVGKIEDAVENVLNKRGLGDNAELVKLLKIIISILQSLDLDPKIYLDGYEVNKRLEKIRKKKEFATNGG